MKLARRLFVIFFVLAMLARLIRVFIPHGMTPHASHASRVEHAEPRYVEGDVVGVDVAHHVLVIHSGVGPSAQDLPVSVSSEDVSIRLGEKQLAVAEIAVGDHATIRLRPPRAGDDEHAANAESVRIARAEGAPR